MCISMVVNILIDNIVSHIAAGRAKVSPTPKVIAPVTLLQFRKLHLHLARTAAFGFLNKIAHWYVRGNAAKDVYMIARHHTVKYLDVHFISHLRNQITNTLLQSAPKHFVTILRDPYQVVAMIIRRMAPFAVLGHIRKTTTIHHYAKPEGPLV